MFSNAIKTIKNHNKFYSIAVIFLLYLIYVIGNLRGGLASMAFFIGFFGSILMTLAVIEKPNEKEKKLVDKMAKFILTMGGEEV